MQEGNVALDRWCGSDPARWPSALVFAPHPDDDVLGLGAQLWARGHLVHVAYLSDGAPESPAFFGKLGFGERSQYALARWREAREALALAGIADHRMHYLGGIDQAIARELPTMTRRVARLLTKLRAEVVFAPPYEGGHPDHDATALAVHAALRLLGSGSEGRPVLLEYASYHRAGDALVLGRFLPDPARPARELVIDPALRRAKTRMLACHATQEPVWRNWPLEAEHVRLAPAYDFRRPPDAPFHYDTVDWGVRGHELLSAAARTLDELRIEGPC